MYPYLRMAKELWKFRNAPALSVFQPHVSTHRVWPWDIDQLRLAFDQPVEVLPEPLASGQPLAGRRLNRDQGF